MDGYAMLDAESDALGWAWPPLRIEVRRASEQPGLVLAEARDYSHLSISVMCSAGTMQWCILLQEQM